MLLGRAVLAHRRRVPGRDVADVAGEAVAWVERVEAAHHPVARHLRDDRRGRDRGALGVAVDDGAVLRRGRAEPEAVDEARLRRRREIGEDRAQPPEVRLAQAVAVDVGQEMTRTLIRSAQPTTARKSSSRSTGDTCFESFSDASGRTLWLRRHS